MKSVTVTKTKDRIVIADYAGPWVIISGGPKRTDLSSVTVTPEELETILRAPKQKAAR